MGGLDNPVLRVRRDLAETGDNKAGEFPQLTSATIVEHSLFHIYLSIPISL